MQVMSIQCPNCGAPLNIEPSQEKIICGSCGSVLELTTGSSGFPMARLVSIGQDTSFIARTQATERLKKQIETLKEEREELKDRIDLPFKPQTGQTLKILMTIGFGLAIVLFTSSDNGAACLVPPLLALGMVGLIYTIQRTQHTIRVKKLYQTYGPKLEALDQEITAKQARIDKLENDLDTIAMSL